MQTLREKLDETSRFLIGTELVSTRGPMTGRSAGKARLFVSQLADCPLIDWISITDNAGGRPHLAPTALGKPALNAGKEVVIHLTCKDRNRNGLESEAWLLNSEGFHNVLAMTGDYPVTGDRGVARPVFDLDSVGLISMLDRMNQGFAPQDERGGKSERLEKTQFLIGAVTSNYKLREGEVVPQYLKLQKKVACGARFIINQVGYDARKAHELRRYMDDHGMKHIPLIGNVYLLNPKVAQVFTSGRIPGVVVTPALLELCLKQGQSADGGKAFFCEFAAKQIAIFRGLGYRGAYLGGTHNFAAIEKVLAMERKFSPDDWKQFAREIKFSRAGEFYHYAEDPATGLAAPTPQTSDGTPAKSNRVGLLYRLSKFTHKVMFTPRRALNDWGAKICAHSQDPGQGPKPLRLVERLSKVVLYQCKDCGDCSLPDIAFLCPESQCAKNQRNGPCGGTREGRCEADGDRDCIWLRAYERLKHDGKEQSLLEHAPAVQNQALRGTSSWANYWLGRDHAAKRLDKTLPDKTEEKETTETKPSQHGSTH